MQNYNSKFKKIEGLKIWQDLLNKALFKTFFHCLEWEIFLEQQFKWLRFERYIWQNQALLSLAKVKVFGREKLISHPFCEYGGPLPLVEKIDGEKFKQDLFSEFKNPVKINFHPHLLNYFQNETRSDLVSLGRVTYWLEGTLNLRKTTRQEIEKAQKQNLRIEKCQKAEDLRDLYNLFIKSAKKHRVPVYPFSFFEYFLRHNANATNYYANASNIQADKTEIILAKFQDRVIAGSIFLFYNKFIHYFLNASDEKYKNLGANYLILWNQIQNKGNRVFDLGGTRIGSSLEIFKRGWGGKEQPILELTNSTDLRSDLPRRSDLQILRSIFGLLPPFLIKKLSPHLLKYKL